MSKITNQERQISIKISSPASDSYGEIFLGINSNDERLGFLFQKESDRIVRRMPLF